MTLLLFQGTLTIFLIITFHSSSSGTIFLSTASIKSGEACVISRTIHQVHLDICFKKTNISSHGEYILPGICHSGPRTTVVESISNTTLSVLTLRTLALKSSHCLF
jgi:hypothetical protein